MEIQKVRNYSGLILPVYVKSTLKPNVQSEVRTYNPLENSLIIKFEILNSLASSHEICVHCVDDLGVSCYDKKKRIP